MVAQSTIQYSFNSGQWSKRLAARVDLQKYNSGAELLENFFVDYRGGATIRPGSKYVIQAFDSANEVRLIPFQASTEVGYTLEFGNFYMRPLYQGQPVLETGVAITGISQANPAVVTVANSWSVGDIVYIAGALGMTQINSRYFKISARTGANITLSDLNGVAVSSAAYSAWTSGGTVSRVYQIGSPYAAEDLRLLRFVQNVNDLIICHLDYTPYILHLTSATSWTFSAIVIGSTVTTPAAPTVATSLAAGVWNYAYKITAVDINGQESGPSAAGTLASRQDIRSVAGTNYISWAAIAGAVAYNVYKAEMSHTTAVPAGAPYGFIGTATGVQLDDSNISPDYSSSPPVARNPFVGGNVISVVIGTQGIYTSVPTITFTGSATLGAVAIATLGVVSATVNGGGGGVSNVVGQAVAFANGVTLIVASVNGAGTIQTWQPITYPGSSSGSWISGSTPANPQQSLSSHGGGLFIQANLVWGVKSISIVNPGAGYASAPTVNFSSGTATATATISDPTVGNPVVPALFQQRLWLMGKANSPQSFEASQSGAYYNFNVSSPIQDDDAISGVLASGVLNSIKAAQPMQAGLVVMSDRASWLINGGSNGSAISPSGIVANPQTFNGISDVPPIMANADIIYVQAKGSTVRNAAYSFYNNVYVGTDISAICSDLFFGYNILEWAWAEEPFKVVWAVRDDGVALSLTFIKEQEFIAWAHSNTNGDYKSVCTITEEAEFGLVDAVYWVVERTVNGNIVKYIERFEQQYYPNGVEDAWQVDSGLRYDSTPATSFTGAEHLAGLTVTGLADGVVITPFTMPTNGFFTLATAASKVTIGLAFTAKLKPLRLDVQGQGTVQGKEKKVPALVMRVADTLGLKAGQDFDHLVDVKDLQVGNVNSMLSGQQSQQITGLFDGDAKVIIAPAWTTTGQFVIQQSQPLPASILGLIPQLVIGDTK